jgi:hypothetical protein
MRRRYRCKVPAKNINPSRNADISDSDMSMAREDLTVAKTTVVTTANEHRNFDSLINFPTPNSTTNLNSQSRNKSGANGKSAKKAPISTYTSYVSDSDDEDYGGRIKGRYSGKDRKIEDDRRRPTFDARTNQAFQPDMNFTSSTVTLPINYLARQRHLEESLQTSLVGRATATRASRRSTRTPETNEVKLKRANCSGPADRVKRHYTWHDGGKRASEAGVQKKIRENQRNQNHNGGSNSGSGGAGIGAGGAAQV